MASEMKKPTLPLLPDLEGEVTLTEGLGLQAAGEEFLSVLAQTMDAPGDAEGADVLSSVRRSVRAITERRNEESWRGMLATVLLWDTWADMEAVLNVMHVEGKTPFSAMMLAARRDADKASPLCLVTMTRADRRAVLGVMHPALGVTPAATLTDLSDILPERVRWYDRASGVFTDPCALLNERDRITLIHRLNLFSGDAVKRFASALLQEGMRASRAVAAGEETALAELSARALAVCGMQDFAALECREDRYEEDPFGNRLLRTLGLTPPAIKESFQPQLTWYWRGKAFARSSSVIGFEPALVQDEAQTLAEAAAECQLLTASASWQKKTARSLREWLSVQGQRRAFSPAARDQLKEIMHQAEQLGNQVQEHVTLQWPWSEDSDAAAWIIRELLGEDKLAGGMRPFADRLALLPDAAPDVLGDPTLCISCALPLEATGMPTVALPPLSADMARTVAQSPDVLRAESFCMEVTELGEVQASFTLRGKVGEVTFTRLYGEEEIVLLQPEETPTVAVWPSVAFPADQWKAYHVYTHGHGLTIGALQGESWIRDDEHLWSVVRTEQFPVCLTVSREGVCLGALLNHLPVFRAEYTVNAVAALDLGMSGTAVALRMGDKTCPMQLPCLVRTLLHGARPAPFDKEFLPAEALGSIVPSWAALFRDTEDPVPLVDGHTGGAEQLDYVRSSLKWGVEGPERKVCLMHLRQTMLTVSLYARMNGARDIAWRVALPADLSPARRGALVEAVRSLAPVVARESCLPLSATQTAVRCVDADHAMSVYLKSAGYQRGGFMSMDVGSGGASLMLWLRGMSRPSAVNHLPLGIHGMLLHALMNQPDALANDFADMQDAAACQAVQALAQQLRGAHGSRKALNRSMLLLDELLTNHASALQQHMNQAIAQGGMTLMQAQLLCGFAWLMTTAGLQLERAWQDATVNDHLPQELPLCLGGRGSLLLTGMPDTLKMRLTGFIRLGMSMDNAVRHVYVTPSAEPKLEVALGAVRAAEGVQDFAADTPAQADHALPIAMLPLLQRFLVTFASQFPMAAQRLWPDLLEEGQFTREAEIRLQSQAAMHPEASPASAAMCLEGLGNVNMK